jgi:alkylated DNA repair dioxygenase AlkB
MRVAHPPGDIDPQSILSEGALPSGFRYADEIISVTEEQELAAWIASLPLKPFEFHGYLGLRRIAPFGFRYDYSRQRAESAEPVPAMLLPLRERVGNFTGQSPERFRQILITEYAAGAPLGWHKDKPQFGDVVGISLLSPAQFRLRRKLDDHRWERRRLTLLPRSIYLMSGVVREEWEHSIPKMPALRYSITFRTLSDSFERQLRCT